MELSELMAHPQAQARGIYMRVGETVQARPAPRFSRSHISDPIAPGAPGANTAEILASLGFSQKEIDAMSSDGTLT
jgi:alpha-methylacyl-CoA racemase